MPVAARSTGEIQRGKRNGTAWVRWRTIEEVKSPCKCSYHLLCVVNAAIDSHHITTSLLFPLHVRLALPLCGLLTFLDMSTEMRSNACALRINKKNSHKMHLIALHFTHTGRKCLDLSALFKTTRIRLLFAGIESPRRIQSTVFYAIHPFLNYPMGWIIHSRRTLWPLR